MESFPKRQEKHSVSKYRHTLSNPKKTTSFDPVKQEILSRKKGFWQFSENQVLEIKVKTQARCGIRAPKSMIPIQMMCRLMDWNRLMVLKITDDCWFVCVS